MAKLHILLDNTLPELRVMVPPPPSVYHAELSLPDGLENRDVYEVARKLAELLLETLER